MYANEILLLAYCIAAAQLELPIEVILGNPPYSVGQKSANDNNANLKYPSLDGRISSTYAARSTATNKNSLYDNYIRAIRWVSDRIGEAGVIGFVMNGGFIDANTSDGVRLSVGEEFSDVYIFNLRGNSRTAGDVAKQEGGNIFDVRVGITITLLVRVPEYRGKTRIHYHDIVDYLSREEKLEIVECAQLEDMIWQEIRPNEQGDWINQRDPRFDTWQSIGGKDKLGGIFTTRSSGLKTNRDAWVYNFSEDKLADRVTGMVEYYNEWADRGMLPAYLDPMRFSWNRADKTAVARGRRYSFNRDRLYVGSYRPFTREHVCFDRSLNDMVYGLYSIFPTPRHENFGFSVMEPRPAADFAVLAGRAMPDVALFTYTIQFFPRYTWEKINADDGAGQRMLALDTAEDALVVNGYRRVDNISPLTLVDYRRTYGPDVTSNDVFFYVYGLLHSPDYRASFAADLKKSLPHIPKVASRADFNAFSGAGRALAELHMDYENVDPWPLEVEGEPAPSLIETDPYAAHRIEKMRYGKAPSGGGGTNKTVIRYNSRITVRGIPERAHEYLLGSRSGLDWIIDRYWTKTDKASGIVNDPNEWCKEVGNPRYILDLLARVTTVSMRTLDIVDSLPELQVED